MRYRVWQVGHPDEGQAKRLADAIGAPLLLARVLAARGFADPEKAMELLVHDAPLSDPFRMKDMDRAVARISEAIDNGEAIVIFGDYDVDGVTATALLYSHLANMGARVRCKLPSRAEDGYGLNERVLRSLAEKGYRLIVTVDNGIAALREAELARELGIDLVITDHHLPGAQLPRAVAVVDPRREDDESPCKSLCGAGVAFKLCAALEGCPPEEMLEFCSDLAAIGTVADVMPLTGENRTLVRAGLENLRNTERPGLAALLEEAGLAEKPVTAENISFALAPRLNAAGRMDSAVTALKLLLCEDPVQAQALAGQLEQLNRQRQTVEAQIMEQVDAQLALEPERACERVVTVWGKDWHPGVIGIVASRLVERFGRPVFVLSVRNGEARGSGRGVPGLDLHAMLEACADLLSHYGGHAAAAGLTTEEQYLPQLRRRMNEWAANVCPLPVAPPLLLDVPIRLNSLTVDDVEGLRYLSPCGSGNPAPLFLLENAVLEGVWPVGNGSHSRLRLRQDGAVLYAVLFGTAPQDLAYFAGDRVDAALSLSVYEGRSGKMLSGRIAALRPAGLDASVCEQTALFEAFEGGLALTESQGRLLWPARADVAAVYRLVRQGAVSQGDLQPLFARVGAQNTARALVSLRALSQLGLVQPAAEGGRYQAPPGQEKRDLRDAPVLRRLGRFLEES